MAERSRLRGVQRRILLGDVSFCVFAAQARIARCAMASTMSGSSTAMLLSIARWRQSTIRITGHSVKSLNESALLVCERRVAEGPKACTVSSDTVRTQHCTQQRGTGWQGAGAQAAQDGAPPRWRGPGRSQLGTARLQAQSGAPQSARRSGSAAKDRRERRASR